MLCKITIEVSTGVARKQLNAAVLQAAEDLAVRLQRIDIGEASKLVLVATEVALKRPSRRNLHRAVNGSIIAINS